MHHFITPEGIVSVEISDDDLFVKLCGNSYRRSNGALECFKHLLTQHYIIFKAFDYPFNSLFAWVYSEKSASNSPSLFNLSGHLEHVSKTDRYGIICFINGSDASYNTHTLYVEKYKVESMIRKATIDEYLIKNI